LDKNENPVTLGSSRAKKKKDSNQSRKALKGAKRAFDHGLNPWEEQASVQDASLSSGDEENLSRAAAKEMDYDSDSQN